LEKLVEPPRRLGLRIAVAVIALGLWTASVFLHGTGSLVFAAFFKHATDNWGPNGRALAEKTLFLGAVSLGLVVLALSSIKVLSSAHGRRATPELLFRWAAALLFAWATNRYLICIQSECVHYAQYGFVAFSLAFATRNPRLALVATVFCGFLDESNQWWRMYFNEVNEHLDWSDMCLNAAGAACGALPWTSIHRLRRYAEGEEDKVATGSPLPQILALAGAAALVFYLVTRCELGHDHSWPYWGQLDNHKPFHQFSTREGVPALLALTILLYYVVDERRKNLPIGALVCALVAWHIGIVLPTDGGQPLHEPVPVLTVPKAKGPIAVDGKLDEKDWQTAAKVELHGFAPHPDEDDLRKQPWAFGPELKTEARLLWDEQALYVAFECASKDVWGRELPRDHEQIANHPCVEVFLDPDNAERMYYEFEVSAANQQADYFVYFPELPQWTPAPTMREFVNLPGWDSKNLASAVTVQGGVCDVISGGAPAVTRTLPATEGYTVEIAIPWQDMKGRAMTPHWDMKTQTMISPLKSGLKLRANLYRVEAHRTEDPAKPAPGTYMAWGPTHAPLDFHRPSFFGQLTLGE
jgi:hypothetical protein